MKNTFNRYKFLLVLAFTGLFAPTTQGQVQAYFTMGAFNTPQNEPFIETYLTIIGNSLAAKEVGGKLQSSATYIFTVFKDSAIVKANKYNLNGPIFADTVVSPSFIDNQRYALPNGTYEVELSVIDNYAQKKIPKIFRETVRLAFNTKDIQSSSIEVLESFKKSSKPTALTKSGYDLVPYCINYFPEKSKELSFYFESYNTDTVFGKNKPFIYYYYIEDAQSFAKLDGFVAFKKQACAKVNPLLAKMDITKLPTGNYNLVIELKDENNIMHIQKKYFFQRLNTLVNQLSPEKYSQSKLLSDYFGSCNNADSLKMFVECLWPISNGIDKERSINQSLRKDPELMKKYIVDFWQRRAADTANPLKMWTTYYKSVREAMAMFKCGRQPGYATDRGRVYLQYGKPSQRSQQNAEQNTYPYEIWQYYKITDAVNGQSSTNRRFVFVNKVMGDDRFMLVHSDMRGEINNDQWRYEVTRNKGTGTNNNNGSNDPNSNESTQLNDLYNNPR